MELLVANFAGKVRRTSLEGREHLVAPLTLIVPGVLNGSKGPLLYLLEDLQATADLWNGIPILKNHSDGSGRNPSVYEKARIGTIFNARVENGKLRAEGWFDVERTRKVDYRILPAIEAGQLVELSTGLQVDTEPVSGTFVMGVCGKPYTGIARNYRPDHLAILPDAVGACSTFDGCGINNANHSEEDKMSVDALIKNCSCTFKEEDREALGKVDNQIITKMAKVVENAQKTQKAATDEVTALKAKLTEQETALNAAVAELEKAAGVTNQDPPADPQAAKDDKVGKKVENQDTPTQQTIQLKDLPTDLQEDITFARNTKQARKQELVDKLTANISDDEAKASQAQRLMARSLSELEADALLLPAQTTTNQQHVPSYLGAGAGVGPTTNQQPQRPTPLGIPVMNFEAAKA